MTIRVTTRWIRTFVNAHKQSSFQDKAGEMRGEPNPFYLLEWLVVEQTDEDEAFWSAWEGERTPGVERGGLAGVETCFRDQLLPELLFGEPMTWDRASRVAVSFADLEARYGTERWKEGLERLRLRAVQSAERYVEYSKLVAEEDVKLENDWKRERKELQEEAEAYEEGDFDLEAELRKIQAKWERRKQELPSKCMQQLYPDDALLRYVVVSGIQKPKERLLAVIDTITERTHPVLTWTASLDRNDFDGLERLWEGQKELSTEWFDWFAAYMSRSDLTRGWLPIEERQRSALQWIKTLGTREASTGQNRAETWIQAAFRGRGWEERLSEDEFRCGLLHQFVWLSVGDEQKRKRLREEVLLKQWSTFTEQFRDEDAGSFEALSWIFALDPESVQQRLLRSGSAGLKAEELIRKLCQLYAEGIRRGLDIRLLVSLYTYLAKHDKESLYSFVHGAKSLAEALPVLELPASMLSQLFRGAGVRQTSARKHLLSIFYDFMEEDLRARKQEVSEALQKLAAVLAYDKRAAVIGWLQRHERNWRDTINLDEERAFTRLLRFRWIGTNGDAAEQHRSVQEWLQRHSDWVQFETDAPHVEAKGVNYKIVKPGAIDAETGEVLSRVTVRAEWADRGEVTRLLDDLKLL
jgi:hypothetical protein